MQNPTRRLALVIAAALLGACGDDAERGSLTQPPTPRVDVAASGWTVTRTDLCAPGCYGAATDINNRGVIIGNIEASGGGLTFTGPFLWTRSGGIRQLFVNPHFSGAAYGINDKGTVVGTGYHADRNRTEAWMWTPAGGMKWLGTLGGSFSAAYKVNLDNQVAGVSRTANGEMHGVRWRPGGVDDLGPNVGQVNDIDPYGIVAGGAGGSHALRATLLRTSGRTDLGVFSGPQATAMAIDATGAVVGYASNDIRDPFDFGTPFYHDAFAYLRDAAGRTSRIPALPGGDHNAAFGMNERGQAVGWSDWWDASHWTHTDAFFWSARSGTIPLFTSEREEATVAFAINDDRQIAGAYYFITGRSPVMWTVTPPVAH